MIGGAYVLGGDAAVDLDEIWEYIAADNLDAADRWIARLYEAFEALGNMPGMGHRRDDLTPSERTSSSIAPGAARSRSLR